MDGQRLDGFARRFALSRRGALKTLAAGAVGAVLGGAGQTAVLAKKKPKDCKDFCAAAGLSKTLEKACTKDCAQGGGLYAACGGDPDNLCVAPSGLVCPDTQSDPQHCGACNNACPDSTDVCENGTCVSTTCNGAPERVCHNASGTFCCGVGESCGDGVCYPCVAGVVSWCVREDACTGPEATNVGVVCSEYEAPLVFCDVTCDEYWRVAYVCLGDETFPGRATCCTPGIDCPACASETGANDPGYDPCPGPVACGNRIECTPPSA